MVDAEDLGLLLAEWESYDSSHELDGGGPVDAADIGILIADEGACVEARPRRANEWAVDELVEVEGVDLRRFAARLGRWDPRNPGRTDGCRGSRAPKRDGASFAHPGEFRARSVRVATLPAFCHPPASMDLSVSKVLGHGAMTDFMSSEPFWNRVFRHFKAA